MERLGKQLEINTIQFESNDTQVSIQGKMYQGLLNYSTEIIISHSQLNALLNKLIAMNESFSVDDYMLAEKTYDYETMYAIQLPADIKRTIAFDNFFGQNEVLQYRA